MDEMTTVVTKKQEDTKGMYLTFLVSEEEYGIEIVYVTEIIYIQAITKVPELPNYIKGIINLRGKIIPVLDVRVRFRKEETPYNDRTCIVVVDVGGTVVGLIVDMVREVMSIDEDDIVPPAKGAMGNQYIQGVAKLGADVKLLLDIERLVSDESLN